jgi:hypothetical protein
MHIQIIAAVYAPYFLKDVGLELATIYNGFKHQLTFNVSE